LIAFAIISKRLDSRSISLVMKSSRGFRFLAWMLPLILWGTVLALYRLSPSVPQSVVEGPAVVLISSGAAVFLFLLSMENPRSGSRVVGESTHKHGTITSHVHSRSATIEIPIAVALISLAVLIVSAGALFNPEKVIFGEDLFALHYPFENYVREALSAGHLPLWNPYIFGGSPGLAHPQYLVFYPPQLLFRLLPLNLAISWAITFHVWLAGISMFFLARHFRLDAWIALLCAFVYMFNSGLMLRIPAGHVWLVYALSWFPLAWLFLDLTLRTGRTSYTVASAVTIALLILTGHPTFPLYLVLFLSLYALFLAYIVFREEQSRSAVARFGARFFAPLIGAIGLSAIQLLPTASLSRQISLAEGYSLREANLFALSATDLIAFWIPHTYVNPDYVAAAWEMLPYLGILTLLLMPLPFLARHQRSFYYFLAGVPVLSILIAFGSSLGVYDLIYTLLPPFRVARVPPRALSMFIPAAVVLAGFALQIVRERGLDEARFRGYIRSCLLLSLFAGGAAVGSALMPDRVSPGESEAFTSSLIPVLVAGLAAIYLGMLGGERWSSDKWRTSTKYLYLGAVTLSGITIGAVLIPLEHIETGQLVLLAALLAGNTLLLSLLYRNGPVPITVFLLFAFISLDLGSAGFRYISFTSPPQFEMEGRVLLQGVPVSQLDRVLSVGDAANHYMLGGLQHVDGYNSGILSGYDSFLRSVTYNAQASTVRILSPNSEVSANALDFLGVRYLVYPAGNTAMESMWPPAENNYSLIINPDPLPRAFIVYDFQVAGSADARQILDNEAFDYGKTVVTSSEPRLTPRYSDDSSVSIERYVPTSGDCTLTAYTSTPGILVTSEPYYSERRVWVNGEEREPLRANLGFIAVELPAGENQIEIRFVPSSLYLGATITFITILVHAGLLSRFYRSRNRYHGLEERQNSRTPEVANRDSFV
jgi:hypothetical protein